MTDLQMLGNSLCEFGLVTTYQRSSAIYLPKSLPKVKPKYHDHHQSKISQKLAKLTE